MGRICCSFSVCRIFGTPTDSFICTPGSNWRGGEVTIIQEPRKKLL